MKLEISELEEIYRLVDGDEDSDTYVTGSMVSFGETSILEKDGEDLPWEAFIDGNGECDGLARQGSRTVAVGFELGCILEADGDEEDDEEEVEDEAAIGT
jgi:hypothetical protein